MPDFNDKQKKAFDPSNMDKMQDQMLAEQWERIKNIPGATLDAVKGVLSPGSVPTEPKRTVSKDEYASYFGPEQGPGQGVMEPEAMSTEQIQKIQEAQKEQQKIQDYLALQEQLKQPPMEVPKSRQTPEQMDPRLADPQNAQRFQEALKRIKGQ